MSTVVVKYHSEFDSTANFTQLQNAIDAVDHSMINYHGKAKSKLNELRQLNSAARLQYEGCVGPVFSYCISIDNTLNLYIRYIEMENLSESDKQILVDMLGASMEKGLTITYKSLDLLTNLQEKVARLKNIFDSIIHDVKSDFAPSGDQRKLISALAAQRTRTICSYFMAAFVHVFSKLGLHYNMPPTEASLQEKIDSIIKSFDIISRKLDNALRIARQIETDLKHEKDNIHALIGLFNAVNNDKSVLLMELKEPRQQLIEVLTNLKTNCKEYAIWHGYGSIGYRHRSRRTAHQAIQSCYEEKAGALKQLNDYLASPNMDVYSIFNTIDCEAIAVP